MDKELLLKPRLPEADVPIAGVGTVRVRGLSRAEVLAVRRATDMDPATIDGPRVLVLERKLLAVAMLDPAMSESDVRRWQEASAAGEIEPVVELVQKLSGMADGSAKEAYKSVRDES